MKSTKSTFIKAFICLSRQDYFDMVRSLIGNEIIDKVSFGNFDAETAGCEYEVSMEWVNLPTNRATPRLRVFNDAFKLFEEHRELINEMVKLNGKDFSPDDFCRLLIKLGYQDRSDKRLEG